MKLEIYQTGKVPPLTVVECDDWDISYADEETKQKAIEAWNRRAYNG